MTTELIVEGQAALRLGDAGRARAAFERAEQSPEVLEGLAAASYILFEYPRAIDEMEFMAVPRRRISVVFGTAPPHLSRRFAAQFAA